MTYGSRKNRNEREHKQFSPSIKSRLMGSDRFSDKSVKKAYIIVYIYAGKNGK